MSTEDFVPSTATDVQDGARACCRIAPQPHPLDPLTPNEIVAISLAVRKHTAEDPDTKAIRFITCNLLPPPKREVLAYLDIPIAPGEKLPHTGMPPRKADVDFIEVVTGDAYNFILVLQDSKWVVEYKEKLPEGTQPQITPEELIDAEHIIRADPEVRRLAAEVGVKPEQIYADGWAIGYDDRFPAKQRIQQALLFARLGEHENLYAHPLDFIPIVDSNEEKVIHIDFPPRYVKDATGNVKLSAPSAAPPPLDDNAFSAAGRERIPPPLEAHDYLPDLIKENDPNFKLRDDIKPLQILQPEGVSFDMSGNQLKWQKWSMHVAFSHREGIALSTITYNDNGEVRPIFYRLSLGEMVVPYAAPETPHPRKFAFDVGEYGMGTVANDLSLGCDCLGRIHYLPGSYVAHDGKAITIKNAVCIHEEDAGILWKHTDFRPGGRSHAVRSRRLVISMVCTVANYEYIFNYLFYQDGTIELEVRLTGILQTYVSAQDEPTPYGTFVAPRINAQYHQHIFSVRVDPMIDGLNNSVIETDILPLGDHPDNHAGNGFFTRETVLGTEGEGGRDYSWENDRRWRIVNKARTHYASGQAAGYGIIMKGASTRLLASPDSWAGTRATFAKKALWVVRDVEGNKGSRMWPAGAYVPQTREAPDDSVGKWAQGDASIDGEDIVTFITLGTTHIPRPEDWPVMPAEHVRVAFKPLSFFKANPSLDVPKVTDPVSERAFVILCDTCTSAEPANE